MRYLLFTPLLMCSQQKIQNLDQVCQLQMSTTPNPQLPTTYYNRHTKRGCIINDVVPQLKNKQRTFKLCRSRVELIFFYQAICRFLTDQDKTFMNVRLEVMQQVSRVRSAIGYIRNFIILWMVTQTTTMYLLLTRLT